MLHEEKRTDSEYRNEGARDQSDDRVLVSVSCISFNHGRFLRKALDSFLEQKTDFRYEILIHDDASTDDTVDIIREYAERHPDIIRPMYEEENQYS
jgi:glycosyltransferase involved in cell wall biosynthesis